MKGLYLANRNPSNDADGVMKKINMQIDALKFRNCDISYQQVPQKYKTLFGRRVLSRLPLFAVSDDWKKVKTDGYDFLYIRKTVFDREFISFLRNAKLKGVKKILLEIPTFPYDAELCGRILDRPIYYKDRILRKRIHRYLDRIVTYSSDKLIFEVPTIRIVNGISFKNQHKKLSYPDGRDSVSLIAVASMQKWHGFDRIIQGLNEYCKNQNNRSVYLHLIGDGPEIEYYKSLLINGAARDYVFFHGVASGRELEEYYANANIGICSLACHRKNVFLSSELKSREYSAKGIPMVASTTIDVFDEKENSFIFKIDGDESIVSIDGILTWYDNLIKEHTNAAKLGDKIRARGMEVCDITNTMVPIADYILDNQIFEGQNEKA